MDKWLKHVGFIPCTSVILSSTNTHNKMVYIMDNMCHLDYMIALEYMGVAVVGYTTLTSLPRVQFLSYSSVQVRRFHSPSCVRLIDSVWPCSLGCLKGGGAAAAATLSAHHLLHNLPGYLDLGSFMMGVWDPKTVRMDSSLWAVNKASQLDSHGWAQLVS